VPRAGTTEPAPSSPGRGLVMADTPGVPLRARAPAIVSLVASAGVVAAVLLFLARNGLYVVSGIAGVGVAVAGGWLLVTTHGFRRVIGIAVALVGVGLITFSLIAAGDENWWSVLRLAVTLALLALAVGTARLAVWQSLQGSDAVAALGRRTPPPRHPVLLCNPWSGGGKVQKFELPELASSLGVETVLLDRGLDLATLARQAVDEGADCLGMAGGDGSQALVASIATEHRLPFVCVSAGTRNHFALDLGLDRTDPRKSVAAFTDAVERRVDYATVNGRFFVNNVSLGVYAAIVQQEGYRDAKTETAKQLLPELLGNTDEPFDLQFTTPDGRTVDGAFLILVSNNPYVLGPSFDVSQRRRLDTGRLGVFAVSAETGAQAAEVVTLGLLGRGSKSGFADQFECEEFEIRSRSGTAFAGIDGEALELPTPLRFRIHPKGLRMLVPEGNLEEALRRGARAARVRDVVTLASGRPLQIS
jgi:diacylglycerol kinase family enzyme